MKCHKHGGHQAVGNMYPGLLEEAQESKLLRSQDQECVPSAIDASSCSAHSVDVFLWVGRYSKFVEAWGGLKGEFWSCPLLHQWRVFVELRWLICKSLISCTWNPPTPQSLTLAVCAAFNKGVLFFFMKHTSAYPHLHWTLRKDKSIR